MKEPAKDISTDEPDLTLDDPSKKSLFYSPNWISVLHRVYGFEMFTAIDASQNLDIHFALVDNIAEKKLVSLPFSDYTDIDNNRSEDYREIVEAMKMEFPEVPILFKTIGKKENTEDNPVFGRVTRNALYHRIATDAEVDAADIQSSSFRRNVKQAQKTGVRVQLKRDRTALKDFYGMYHGLRLGKFGSIPQPYPFFEAIFEEFLEKDKGFLMEASYKNKPIASIMVLQYGDILYYKFGASTEESLDLRPNNLIFDVLISHAIDNGFKAVDLGLSGTGESYKGLVRFKESMGGRATPIIYYRSDNGCKNTDRNAAVKQWLGELTDKIVVLRPGPSDTSELSETIYPLFA